MQIIWLSITTRNVAFYLISSMASVLLDQLEDLLIVVSNRIARAFNTCEATRAVALDISKVFHSVFGMLVLLIFFIFSQ